jgi:hypothetical protein
METHVVIELGTIGSILMVILLVMSALAALIPIGIGIYETFFTKNDPNDIF